MCSHPRPAVVDVGRATLLSPAQPRMVLTTVMLLGCFQSFGSVTGMFLIRGSGSLGLLETLEFSWAEEISSGNVHLLLLKCDHCQGFHPFRKQFFAKSPIISHFSGEGISREDKQAFFFFLLFQLKR